MATVQCKELIAASSGGKVHGKVSLTGVDGLRECVCVGSVEYWMRFKHPVTQSLRLYQVMHSLYSSRILQYDYTENAFSFFVHMIVLLVLYMCDTLLQCCVDSCAEYVVWYFFQFCIDIFSLGAQ